LEGGGNDKKMELGGWRGGRENEKLETVGIDKRNWGKTCLEGWEKGTKKERGPTGRNKVRL